jgi:hypothetical protein
MAKNKTPNKPRKSSALAKSSKKGKKKSDKELSRAELDRVSGGVTAGCANRGWVPKT